MLPVVAPATSVTVQLDREGPLYVGTSFTWTCTVAYDSTVVDTPINITISFNNTDSSDGTRVRTGSIEQVNDTMFQGETVYRVLGPSDILRRPACSSSFTSASEFVDSVENPSEPIFLPIEGELDT